ncbi:hypothetical protein BC332_11536 [Capsicum chinense]|nr:hypothetical protein BC332_11536 [Capsicum chinense]
MDSEDDSMELEDSIFSEEGGEECELGAQTNHTFSDGTNFQGEACLRPQYTDNKFISAAEKILRDNMSEGDSFYVENVSGDEKQFTVFGSGCTIKVDLLERSYSCRKFDLVKIPCVHTMAALRLKQVEDYGLRVYNYSSPLYKVEKYLLAYSKSINVVPLEFEWRVPQELLDVNIIPPLVVTKLERKKRKCVKNMGETFKSKRRNKCSLCKRPGHKRTTCNNNKS